MVAATREGLDRISAERRARWLQKRRRRRVFWLAVAALLLAGLAVAVWPRGGGSPAQPRLAAPTRHMPVRPLDPLPDSLAGLRAALPMAAGVAHGDPAQRMVALTFDDGPSGRTPAILRVLANHHAHATFFVVGRSTRGMEPVLRHMARDRQRARRPHLQPRQPARAARPQADVAAALDEAPWSSAPPACSRASSGRPTARRARP